jgi:formylglycine-generating enzyme required for sulfatase activity
MTILRRTGSAIQLLGALTLVLGVLLACTAPALAAEKAEPVDKADYYSDTPSVKWLTKPYPVPDAAAKTEAEMKNYTEVLPSTELKFDMVAIKGGKFKMGSPATEKDRKPDEGPQVEVKIEPFWMGKYEVTWDEFGTWAFELDKQRRHQVRPRRLQGGTSAANTTATGRSPGGRRGFRPQRRTYGPQTAVDVPRPVMAFGLVTST